MERQGGVQEDERTAGFGKKEVTKSPEIGRREEKEKKARWILFLILNSSQLYFVPLTSSCFY